MRNTQHILQDYEEMNRGIVNSIMYEKQAIHFTKTNQVDSAIKYLSLGEWPRPPIKLQSKMYKMCQLTFSTLTM